MFVKFCMKCHQCFDDPDKYAAHVKQCGQPVSETVQQVAVPQNGLPSMVEEQEMIEEPTIEHSMAVPKTKVPKPIDTGWTQTPPSVPPVKKPPFKV